MTSEIQRRSVAELLTHEPLGQRERAAARATNRVVGLLHEALESSGLSQRHVADALGVTEGRVSQVMSGDGNVFVSTLARYLMSMGYELELAAEPTEPHLRPIGERRRRRRAREQERGMSDAYIGTVLHNGAEHVQVLFTEPGVPAGAMMLVDFVPIGRVENPEKRFEFRSVQHPRLEA